MKDLRFKIIADFVKGGFDAAGGAINSLKAKFASFFDGQKGGWGKMGTVIGVAVTAIYKAGEAARQSWLADMKRMRDATEDFANDSSRNFRRIRFMDTEEEKAAIVEKLDSQIREIRKRREEIRADEDTESVFGGAMGLVESIGRKIRGQGFEEASEAEFRQLGDHLKVLERQRELAKGRETKDAAKAAKAKNDAIRSIESEWMDEEAANRAERLRADKARHDAEIAWAKEEADAVKKSMDDQVQAATEAAEKRIKLRELVEGVREVRRDIARENATPEQRRAMDAARFRDIRRQVMAKNELGDFALPPEQRAELIKEGLRIQQSLKADEKKSEEERKAQDRKSSIRTRMMRRGADVEVDDNGKDEFGVKRMRRGAERAEGFARSGFRGGLRWRAGAMAAEAAGTPGPVDDPQLREAKETNRILKNIEKKTGAAP